ncbi:MAG: tRNA-dihydrouridine synthase [Patescibacteria group bacterium]|nr:tRNA-dihydrouridine synthase [Patescibacteria group bacterium]
MNNFWQELKKSKKNEPILALAPLAGYTDSAFRFICKEFGADVVYSEMASVSALSYKSDKTLKLLKFNKKERPYVVQLFGSDKNQFIKAVKILEKKIKPDGFDINFGCPVRKVLKQGAGSKLMGDLSASREIIEAVLNNTKLSLSIKVRTSAFSVDLIDFLKNISDLPVSALMIHGRSLKQLFSGPIDLELIKESRNYFSGVILANGGIDSLDQARDVYRNTGVDGVAFARGVLGQPWIFSEKFQNVSGDDRKKLAIETALKHLKLVRKNRGEISYNEFKGHLAWYLKDFSGASSLRLKIMLSKSYQEMQEFLSTIEV